MASRLRSGKRRTEEELLAEEEAAFAKAALIKSDTVVLPVDPDSSETMSGMIGEQAASEIVSEEEWRSVGVAAPSGDGPRWRDLPMRQKLDIKQITGTLPIYPLAVLFGLNAVDELDRTAFTVLLPEIREGFGLSITGITGIITAVGVFGLLIELPVAYYADRKRRTLIAAGGGGLWAFFSAMTGFAGIVLSLPLLYISRIGSSLGKTANATHLSLLSDYYPPESRVRVLYAHRFANSIGQFVGPLAAGVLAAWISWQFPFFLLALPTIIFVVLALRMKDPKRGVYERLAAGADEATANTEEDAASVSETFRVLFNNRSAKRIYYSLPFLSAAGIGLPSLISLYYEDVFNLSTRQRGVLFAFIEPVQIVSLIVGAVIVQRMVVKNPGRAMNLLGIVGLGQGICLALMAIAPTIWLGIAAHYVSSFFSAMLTPGILAVISLAVPARMRTFGFATGNLWLLLGTPAILFAGIISDRWGIRGGILFFTPVYLMGAFLLASSGNFINDDIKKVRVSSLAQAEARRRRLDGDPQVLIVRDLDVSYDQTQVLFGVNFEVADGEIVALLGTNGAGKSTLLKAISGLLLPDAGAVLFDGKDITSADPVQTAVQGVSQVPGGRGIFPSLTVAENLRAAGWLYRKDPEYLKAATARVLEYFPSLERRWDTPAGSLSGGEQQMLSLSQAFIAKPKLLMIDELSLGLAPAVVEKLLEIVRAIHDSGTTIILVEQSVNVALRLAKRAVFMEKGEIRFTGPTHELLERKDILRAVFLKGAEAGMQEAESPKALTSGQKAEAKRTQVADAKAEATRRAALLEQPVVLETYGLTKRYGAVTAVSSVDLKLHKGQILGLIGPNGAGKTTLFDLISGFQPSNGGTIIFEDTDITELPAFRRAMLGLGRSFQDARLYTSLTVREAIATSMQTHVDMTNPLPAMFGLPIVKESEARVEERVEELIGMMGLGAFRDKFISELSTGSRRMVEIATLLANEPKVIILDEPSSGIAQKETEQLGPVLREVQRYTDCSILIIEHDMPLLSGLADHIYALELGAVIAFGTPDEVLEHPRVIESYLGTHSYAEIDPGEDEEASAASRPARKRAPAKKAAVKKAPPKKAVAKASTKKVAQKSTAAQRTAARRAAVKR